MHIVHIISSLKRGGAETLLANLLQAWLHNNHDRHTVIYFHDGPLRHKIEALNIDCLHIQAYAGFYNPLLTVRLFLLLKHLKPERIITHLWAANLLGRICARMLHIPCAIVLHTVVEHEGRLRKTIDQLITCRPAKIIAVSEPVRKSYVQNRVSKKDTEIITIRNGIDPEQVIAQAHAQRAAAAATLAHIPADAYIIGAVGRFIPEKNYQLLLNSVAELILEHPKIHVVLVGAGAQEQALRAQVVACNLQNHVTFIINKPAYGYYLLFDSFVQPSKFEGLSIALLEAAACARPIIVTGAEREHPVIVHEQSGIVLSIDTHLQKELTNALASFIKHPAQAALYGQAAYKRITDQFHMSNMVKAYCNLLEELR